MFLTKVDLMAYGLPRRESDLSDRGFALLKQQHDTWPLLQKGASTLGMVVVREIEFDGFSMKLQFNPGRIVSSSAKVDAKSIAERKCFLCLENLPTEQKGVIAGDDTLNESENDVTDASNYVVLVNPFPIFPEHFTIPHQSHVPQRIADSIGTMLDITRDMGSRYTLFYNGPRCGASAPDHLHFQAGDRGFMTIDSTWEQLVQKHGKWIRETSDIRIAKVDDGLRRFVVIESSVRDEALKSFNKLYRKFESLNWQIHPNEPDIEEPMLNILCSFEQSKWRLIIFLRKKHRPTQFFAEGDDKILFSPASVDFGGVCITPVEKDFNSITREDLTDMFNQLSVDPKYLHAVADELI
ncbi:MAG TPA: DUF4922 domain-containing protein [Bacteroidetes bacterium]|nr:DUF4922 domain-containing protein [Bacteroidota bacterium]